MSYSTLLTALEQHIMIITLNRPELYNAFNEQMSLELQQALQTAAQNDTVRCVILTGTGKAFCSGQDLREPLPNTNGGIDFSNTVRKRYNPIVTAMRDLPKPIIAGINGVAAGAGLSIALGCDLRIMSASAKLVEGFTGIALIPDAGGSYYLARMLGYSQAFEYVALNEPMTAEIALQQGLVNRVFSDNEFSSNLLAFAQHIAVQPTKTLGLAKRLLQQALTGTLEESLEAEALAQQQAGESQDFQIGVQAFLQKQQPVFTGR